MPKRDIIVMGASSGGVEALREVLYGLPADLPASLFVVMHVPARSPGVLPQLLSRPGNLVVAHAVDGEAIQPGRVYVAPPDRHMVVERGHVHVTMGPKEQLHRPCINITFRTAAAAYGERVAGVILSGQLDDGTAGLWEVKQRGGVCIVQHPEEAAFPSMPLSALRDVPSHHVLRVKEIGPLLTRLASEKSDVEQSGTRIPFESPAMERELTDITCPECRGTIWEISRGTTKDFACRVGHTYSAHSMLAEHAAAQEKALYAAMVALQEAASLATRLAGHSEGDMSARLLQDARRRERQAEIIQQILTEGVAFPVD